MCGIFAYIGKKQASPILLNGLKRLEYRGYDSWGIAVMNQNKITIEKDAGKISDVKDLNNIQGSIGIAHTRWATNGAVNKINAHPHYSSDKSFCLAQNGIVDNYEILKEELLKKGYSFISETDTEVIVRLIEDNLKENSNLLETVRKTMSQLTGRNTIILLTEKGDIIAARNGSPLVVGFNEELHETFFSSDTLSFAPYVNKILVVDNGQIVSCINDSVELYDTKSGEKLTYSTETISFKSDKVDKGEFDYFMLKEIYDTPFVLNQLIEQDHHFYDVLATAIKEANQVYTIGSGTAGAAAAQIAYYLRRYGKIKTTSLIGADAQEYYDLFTDKDLIIAPSQSGETADVLEVLEIAKAKGVKIASHVNMPGSTMTRMSDYKFMAQAGPEISVLSTKIFTSQIAWGYLLAKTVQGKMEEGIINLQSLSRSIEEYLHNNKNHDSLKQLTTKLKNIDDIFMLGKGQNFMMVKEGMVKIIECSYKHAHAMPSGDLKHYAITLMQKGVPVIVALSNDEAKSDVLNAINEVKARGAWIIGIASFFDDNFDEYIKTPDTHETSAIMNIIPLQLLAYYLGKIMGNDIDKPRNIAKSVTVK